MEQFKKNAAVIVLGVIAAAMLIGNICFMVFAKSSVKKATITKYVPSPIVRILDLTIGDGTVSISFLLDEVTLVYHFLCYP